MSAILALTLAALGIVIWSMRNTPPPAQRACDQLSVPGLTITEGRAILSRALADGVPWPDLHSRCAYLVDDFARQSAGSSQP